MLKEFQLKPRAWLYLVKKPGGQVINLTLQMIYQALLNNSLLYLPRIIRYHSISRMNKYGAMPYKGEKIVFTY